MKLRLLLVILLLSITTMTYASDKMVIFAAASLTDVLTEVTDKYNKNGGNVVISFGGSGALARQIDAGAPANIFISANDSWVEYLQEKGAVNNDSVQNFVNNSLVLIAHKDYKGKASLDNLDALYDELKNNRIVLGAVDSVPVGIYSKEAFTNMAIWDNIAKNVAEADNVRNAMSFVARGEAPFSVVYRTDAMADSNVKIISTFPEDSHRKVSYPIAIIGDKPSAETIKLYNFLLSDESKATYQKSGFVTK